MKFPIWTSRTSTVVYKQSPKKHLDYLKELNSQLIQWRNAYFWIEGKKQWSVQLLIVSLMISSISYLKENPRSLNFFEDISEGITKSCPPLAILKHWELDCYFIAKLFTLTVTFLKTWIYNLSKAGLGYSFMRWSIISDIAQLRAQHIYRPSVFAFSMRNMWAKHISSIWANAIDPILEFTPLSIANNSGSPIKVKGLKAKWQKYIH